MTAQHTPGPWRMSADSDETMNPAFLVTESNTTDWPSIVAEFNGEANARLIAAAPDLLAALLYWKNECSGNEPSISVFNQMVDAAIQKATKEQV